MEIQELLQFRRTKETAKYEGPCYYKIDGIPHPVAPWHHPSAFANTILTTNRFTRMTGVAVMAPPGHGKSTFVDVLGHHIHTKKPEFLVVEAGAYEFTHQKQFFSSLPKRPVFVKFRDVTAALDQMTDKEIAQNFEALTKVRWIMDPKGGNIPIIICAESHYSKKVEKAFRAQFGFKVFVGFGDEEKTNIDQLVERKSKAYYKLRQFSKIYQDMFEKGKFSLQINPKETHEYITDDPFRCACGITLTKANMILFSNKDVCEYCTKKEVRKFLDPQEIINKIHGSYERWGLQALKIALYDKGFYNAISPKLASALDFVQGKVLSRYDTNYEELIKLLYGHKKVPKRVYHKRSMENELMDEFEDVSTVKITESKDSTISE